MAHLVLDGADGQPGGVLGDDEGAGRHEVGLRGVGGGYDEVQAGQRAVGDEALRPAYHVVVTVGQGLGGHLAALGLGDGGAGEEVRFGDGGGGGSIGAHVFARGAVGGDTVLGGGDGRQEHAVLVSDDLGQPLLPLVVRASVDDGSHGEPVADVGDSDADVAPGQLFGDDGEVKVAEAGPSVRLGYQGLVEAQGVGLPA